MALTRKFLSALGIEPDKIDEIITAHTETTDALKSERDKFKEAAEKLPGVQAELDGLKAEAAKNGGKDSFKVKYEAIKEEFDQYKADQAAKESTAKKTAAYRELLREAGIREKRIDAVLRVSDVDSVELDENGKLKGKSDLLKGIKSEWADFIDTETVVGANTPTPPTNAGSGKMTKAEIYAKDESGRYKLSASERQKALAENFDLMKG